MIMFEDKPVLFLTKNARMNFFIFHAYPLRDEVGKVIKDTTPYEDLLKLSNDTYALLKRVESRIERGIRIPRTWTAQMKAAEPLVLALRESRATTVEWHDGYHAVIRYLESLND